MKRVLDEDLRITLTQLDTEHEATEKLIEERIEDCYRVTQELDQELANVSAQVKKDTQEVYMQVNTNPKWLFLGDAISNLLGMCSLFSFLCQVLNTMNILFLYLLQNAETEKRYVYMIESNSLHCYKLLCSLYSCA